MSKADPFFTTEDAKDAEVLFLSPLSSFRLVLLSLYHACSD
jgi:hypothetical protein